MVSVVIPLYNKIGFIQRAVNSVLAQTRSDFELIVVDDGSDDDGPTHVAQMSDERVRLVSQSNAGVAAARNRGIAEATRPLVAFLDADDEWEPGFLDAVVGLHHDFPSASVFATGYRCQWPDGRCHDAIIRGIPSHPWRGILSDYFSIAATSAPPVSSSAVAISRAAINSIGGFPTGVQSGEDLLTWARLACQYPIARTTDILAIYHRFEHNDGVAREPANNDIVGRELAAMIDHVADGQRLSLKRYVALWHRMRANSFLRLGKRRQCLAEIGRSASYNLAEPRLGVYLLLLAFPQSGPLSGSTLLDRLGRCRQQ